MSKFIKCVCGNKVSKYGLCEECIKLLKVKKMKDITAVERLRSNYNNSNDTYKTYGQFVAFVEVIYRRKKQFDNTRKKASVAKVRSIGRSY